MPERSGVNGTRSPKTRQMAGLAVRAAVLAEIKIVAEVAKLQQDPVLHRLCFGNADLPQRTPYSLSVWALARIIHDVPVLERLSWERILARKIPLPRV
jgi:hypothetical protein